VLRAPEDSFILAASNMPDTPAPDFELPATGGSSFRLADARGRTVVLYFYPKDNTPGCTTEGQQFRDLHGEFANAGCDVYGISRDSLKSHESFKSKMGFPFELLSDADETACQLFGVIKMKNMYGKKVRGIERSTFVVDRNGVLCREWRGVKVPGHVQEVLDFVRTLPK
jgi:thioredoxin-dependent peroxiredoxin